MIIVVPLRAVFAARRVLNRIQNADAIVVVFKHQMDMTPGLRGEVPSGDAEIVQHGDFTEFGDAVHGIEPQPVEAEFVQPVQRILDGEGAHLRDPVVDRAAPGGLRFREEVGCITAEVITLGAEMIVDHVEKHHQPAQMGFVDQGFEILRPSIGAVGRVPQHAVIAPIA